VHSRRPESREEGLYNVFMRREGEEPRLERRPVAFTRLRPEAAAARPASAEVITD